MDRDLPSNKLVCISHASNDVLRKIFRLVLLNADEPWTPFSLSLVCKRWNALLKDKECKFWWGIFQEIERDRQKLADGRYRTNPRVFHGLSLRQRFACSVLVEFSLLPRGFTGFASRMVTFRTQGRDEVVSLQEGYYVNGFLRRGIEYILDCQIQEGYFDAQESFRFGRFTRWQESVDGETWFEFFGRVNPRNDFRDEGVAVWRDARTYRGQFHHCFLEGFGAMFGADGKVIASGLWFRDQLQIEISLESMTKAGIVLGYFPFYCHSLWTLAHIF